MAGAAMAAAKKTSNTKMARCIMATSRSEDHFIFSVVLELQEDGDFTVPDRLPPEDVTQGKAEQEASAKADFDRADHKGGQKRSLCAVPTGLDNGGHALPTQRRFDATETHANAQEAIRNSSGPARRNEVSRHRPKRPSTLRLLPSDHVVWRKPTRMLGVTSLDLQRGMRNFKSVLELVADFVQQPIVKPRSRAHQMRRQGGFGCAHRPDVKIVDFAHAGKSVQIALHACSVDALRNRRQRHHDGLAQQAPGAPYDETGNHK